MFIICLKYILRLNKVLLSQNSWTVLVIFLTCANQLSHCRIMNVYYASLSRSQPLCTILVHFSLKWPFYNFAKWAYFTKFYWTRILMFARSNLDPILLSQKWHKNVQGLTVFRYERPIVSELPHITHN